MTAGAKMNEKIQSKWSREVIEDFLFMEYDLIDDWKLKEWAVLFVESGRYLIPSMDNLDGDPDLSLYIVADEKKQIVGRVERLLRKEAHVEFPHSITRHLIGNIQLKRVENDIAYVTCNFITSRTKRELLDFYTGRIQYQLIHVNDEIRILEKRVIFSLDALRPQGKASIIF
jgi:p-cumate 2,3-dioxygenase subunit beta